MPYTHWRTRIHVRKTRIEMIPLMDCMFLLLCFFIYVTMSMVVQRGIFVDLAQARTGEATQERDKNSVVLSINRQGQLFLDKKMVTEAQLRQDLQRFKNQKKEGVVLINADKVVTHERVMAALDWVRQSGVTEVVFTVEPAQ